jgi:hypothetical protein
MHKVVKPMKTQAWGWLAAAVMAAGLNASYHDGGMQWAHRIAGRVGHNTSAVLALATGRADQFLAEAQIVAAHQRTPSCPWATAMARAQQQVAVSNARFDRFEAISDRQVARLERFEAGRVRMEAQLAAMRIPVVSVSSVAFSPVVVRTPKVVCPRVRVNIPRPPHVTMPSIPEIHIETLGAGPV